MNARVVLIVLWMACAALAGGGAWKLKAGLPYPDDVDINASLYDPEVIKGETVDYNANLQLYKPLEALSLRWVPIKPPPSDSPISVEKFKPPLALTRVINQRMVQLLDTSSNSKTFYNVGEPIIQKIGIIKKPMGKLLELNVSDPKRALLKIEYLNPQTQAMEPFELTLETNKVALLSNIEKKKKLRKLRIGNPNALEEHEGKEVGKNEYELNYEFHNAVKDNSASELGKVRYELDEAQKARISTLSNDSILRKIGIKEHDVLLSVNGKEYKGMAELGLMVMQIMGGNEAKTSFQVRRAGQVETYSLTRLSNAGAFKEKYE